MTVLERCAPRRPESKVARRHRQREGAAAARRGRGRRRRLPHQALHARGAAPGGHHRPRRRLGHLADARRPPPQGVLARLARRDLRRPPAARRRASTRSCASSPGADRQGDRRARSTSRRARCRTTSRASARRPACGGAPSSRAGPSCTRSTRPLASPAAMISPSGAFCDNRWSGCAGTTAAWWRCAVRRAPRSPCPPRSRSARRSWVTRSWRSSPPSARSRCCCWSTSPARCAGDCRRRSGSPSRARCSSWSARSSPGPCGCRCSRWRWWGSPSCSRRWSAPCSRGRRRPCFSPSSCP